MKIIITHNSPDLDAITSVWLIKKYLSGWENAEVNFVPAGTKLTNIKYPISNFKNENPIEKVGNDEIIHVDTGLGPLDHHQTSDLSICAASLTYEYVKTKSEELKTENSDRVKTRLEALKRIVKFVVALDHFQEVFWPNAAADYYEFGFFGILEGYKTQYPGQDIKYVEFGILLLETMLHRMEEIIWAEEEIKEKGKVFNTRFGKSLGIETLNDDAIKLAQKMGYVIVVRKDPRKGYVRVKALPSRAVNNQENNNVSLGTEGAPESSQGKEDSGQVMTGNKIDLTLVKEQLAKMDPKATWFLHVSKKMLLNGTPKNPKMIPTTLSLQQIINVVERI